MISEEILRIEADHRRMQYVDLDQIEPVPATTTSEIITDFPLCSEYFNIRWQYFIVLIKQPKRFDW